MKTWHQKELNVTIVRVGTNQKYSTGWDKAFGKQAFGKKTAADKPSAKKKVAPKKAGKKAKK